jgi:hypothetical protein
MRKATAIPYPWRANAIALALGLAIIGFGAGLAHPAARTPSRPSIAQILQPQAGAPDFICHAPPGGWCDLRDWSGLNRAPARPGFNLQ